MNPANNNFNLNRPIYLARRDMLLEKAQALLPECLKDQPPRKRLDHVDAVLDCLNLALEPAQLAVQSERAKPIEESLIVFLKLAAGYLQAARAILEYEAQLDNPQDRAREFLRQEGGKAASAGFPRSGEHLLQNLARLLRAAEPSFRELRKTLPAALTPEERDRYRRACDGFKTHGHAPGRLRRLHMRLNFFASSSKDK